MKWEEEEEEDDEDGRGADFVEMYVCVRADECVCCSKVAVVAVWTVF